MKKLISISILILVSQLTFADYIVAKKIMIIKDDPDKNSNVVRRTVIGEKLELMKGSDQSNGYYFVKAGDGKSGYVYKTVGKVVTSDISDLPSENPIKSKDVDENCEKYLKFGVPKKTDQILCREGYVVGYSYENKIPEWVIYIITAESISKNGGDRSKSKFKADEEVPESFRSQNSDYERSGFDKGHMANAAAMDFTQHSVDESFLLSNMTPQLPEFNRDMMGKKGVWGRLENKERAWVKSRKELYVFTGTIVTSNHSVIGNGVAVPNLFYKVIFDPIKIDAVSFLMPQDKNSGDDLESYIRSIDEIEIESNSDLLNTINPKIQSLIEGEVASIWKE